METAAGGLQPGRQFGLVEFVVAGFGARLLEHASGQVDADQTPAPRRQQRAAQTGATAGVEDLELLRRRRQALGQGVAQQIGCAILQVGAQLLLEARGKAVEGVADIRIAGTLGLHVGTYRSIVMARGGVVGVEFEPAAEGLGGLVRQPVGGVQDAEETVPVGVFRVDADGRRATRDGAFDVAPLPADQAEVVVGIGQPVVEFDRLQVGLLGLRGLFAGVVDRTEIVPGAGAGRVDREGFAIGGLGLVDASGLEQHVAEVHMEVDEIGDLRDRPADQRDALIGGAGLAQEDAVEVLQVWMLRCHLKQLLVELAGGFEVVLAVHPERQLDGFGQVEDDFATLGHGGGLVAAARPPGAGPDSISRTDR